MDDRKPGMVRYLTIAGGALLYTLGLNLFVTPMHLYSGGAMGIAQIIRTLLVEKAGVTLGNVDLSGIIYYILNIPLMILAFKGLNKSFFFKTLLAITVTTVAMSLIPIPAPIVADKLTGCIIGGMTVGAGIGIMLMSGGSGGGLDILWTYLAGKGSNRSVGRFGLCCNIMIYAVCAILFNVETAVYSVILSAVSSITLDRVHFQNIMMQMTIVTKVEGVAKHIMDKTRHGVTEWDGNGAYTNQGVHVLLTVVSKYEVSKVRRVVRECDPHAFISYNRIDGLDGNFKKRLL